MSGYDGWAQEYANRAGANSFGEYLSNLYIDQLFSEQELSHFFGVSRSVITGWLEECCIKRRGIAESLKAKWQRPSKKMVEQSQQWQSLGMDWSKSEEGRAALSNRTSGDNNPAKRDEVRQKISDAKMGEGNAMYGLYGPQSPNWKGGYSHRDYRKGPIKFTEEVRVRIRDRDDYTCQECGEYGKDVHHIDYNKSNNDDLNLITLCHRCHMKTNGPKDRSLFTDRYNSVLSGRFRRA